VVVAEPGLAKVAVPGPLTVSQVVVTVLPVGSPSSETLPLSVAAAGSVTAWSAPAFTTGAALVGPGSPDVR
jgi:hypothetical protein